jgi:hypothetical protein
MSIGIYESKVFAAEQEASGPIDAAELIASQPSQTLCGDYAI